MENYIDHVCKKAEQEIQEHQKFLNEQKAKQIEKMDNTFEKYFSFSNAYFNRTEDGVPFLSVQPQEILDLHRYLVAFANIEDVVSLFGFLKNSLAKDAIYNKDYWHLTDGYLSEHNENFVPFMLRVENYANQFGEILLDLYKNSKITDLELFVKTAIYCIEEILEMVDAANVDLNSYQFTEITLLKHLNQNLKTLLYSYNITMMILPNS